MGSSGEVKEAPLAKSYGHFEEMRTILCQIGQVLNNRPLMALTNNPDDIFGAHPVNASHWQPIGGYPTCLFAKDGCPRASTKTISCASTAALSILEAMVLWYVASLQP